MSSVSPFVSTQCKVLISSADLQFAVLQFLGVVFVNGTFLRASDLLLVTVARSSFWSSFCHDLLRSICSLIISHMFCNLRGGAVKVRRSIFFHLPV